MNSEKKEIGEIKRELKENYTKDRKERKETRSLDIPYFLHEMELARMEREKKRTWTAWIICFISLVLTNAAWVSHIVFNIF